MVCEKQCADTIDLYWMDSRRKVRRDGDRSEALENDP